MDGHPPTLPKKCEVTLISRMKIVVCTLVGCVIALHLYAGELFTNGIPELLKSVLPEGVRRWPPEEGFIRKRGPLGNVPHFYLGLLGGSRGRIATTHGDALLIVVPRDYAYPNAETENIYKGSYLGRTSKFQAFLVVPKTDDELWDRLRIALKKELETPPGDIGGR